MAKKRKTRGKPMKHRVIIRVTDLEYAFLQSMGDQGTTITDYVRTAIRGTPRYVKFMSIMRGKDLEAQKKLLEPKTGISWNDHMERIEEVLEEKEEEKEFEMPEGFGI